MEKIFYDVLDKQISEIQSNIAETKLNILGLLIRLNNIDLNIVDDDYKLSILIEDINKITMYMAELRENKARIELLCRIDEKLSVFMKSSKANKSKRLTNNKD